MIAVSLDPISTWPNKILHNSRWFMWRLDRDGTLENIALTHRTKSMRKCKAKSVQDAIDRINKYLATKRS